MEPIKVLDKGFVRLVDAMGDDAAIVQAARVSYGGGTKTKREDNKLIDYLCRNEHMTPFEMVDLKFHVKVPLFIARQWHRHRTASINEVSARYSKMTDEFYIPNAERIQSQADDNKQGSSGTPIDRAVQAQEAIKKHSEEAYQQYLHLIGIGVARETARMVLPTNLYTEYYWKSNLRNVMHFLKLRCDPHAQWEIQQYAFAMLDLTKEVAPVAVASFQKHWLQEAQ